MRLKALLKPSNAAACELGHVRCGPWPRRVIMQSGNDKTDHPRVRGGAYDLIFEEDTVLELHVRRVPGGLASDHWLFGTVAVGDRVDAIGPLGDFHVPTTEEDAGEPMVLIGGGTGLAPLVGIVRTALARHPERAVVLYHGVRDESDLYDRERFAELEARPTPASVSCRCCQTAPRPATGRASPPTRSLTTCRALGDGPAGSAVPRRWSKPASRPSSAGAWHHAPHQPRGVHAGRRARHRLNV